MQILSTWISLASLLNIVFKKCGEGNFCYYCFFGILLFESRLALSPNQQVTGKERVEFSVKNQKNI